MTQFQKNQFIIGLAVLVLSVLITISASNVFNLVNDLISVINYNIRGESKIDSSIAIVYFSNEDTETLGGYPLKRSYYALLVRALTDLGAGAIGIDVGFNQPDERYIEYDNLLTSVIGGNPRVILSGYFRKLESDINDENIDTTLNRFLYYNLPIEDIYQGKEPNFPFLNLRNKSSNIGFTNLIDNKSIPLFIKYGNGLMPSLGFEVFRVGFRGDRNNFGIKNGMLLTNKDGNYFEIPLKNNCTLEINFTGGKRSLNLYSAVDLLKMYDDLKKGLNNNEQNNFLKNKLVLVGIIAEGRSSFLKTPYEDDFPAIGIHAMFIHNILHQSFLDRLHIGFAYGIVVILAIISIYVFSSRKDFYGFLLFFVFIIALLIIEYLVFIFYSFIIPVAQPIFILLCVGITLWLYKHRHIRKEVELLTREKLRIEEILEEKKNKLISLEQELSAARENKTNENLKHLEMEIKKYQDEISQLKSQAQDLQKVESLELIPQDEKIIADGIVYSSKGPMNKVISMVKTVADSDATVLLLGESGTGKELIARALHNWSRRCEHPFVAVNCGALTETLLESELFGHEKGAFTGAIKEREGRFDLANKGTIFLDEIGDTTEAFQVKLLRVLQDGTFERVGGNQMRKVDVRIIAATNKDLYRAVKEKKFREDLFYRLNVISIEIPPLRERNEDLPLLVDHFMKMENPEMHCSASVMEIFRNYHWRGNVRELHSVIKRAVLLAQADGRTMLRVKDLPPALTTRHGISEDLEDQIISTLREKKFSRSAISETAEILGGLNRGTVAEYFRGYCFKILCESNMDIKTAIIKIADSEDTDAVLKVERKLNEYISNAAEFVDNSLSLDEILLRSKPKYKNLPQRYHIYLDRIISAIYEGKISR